MKDYQYIIIILMIISEHLIKTCWGSLEIECSYGIKTRGRNI